MRPVLFRWRKFTIRSYPAMLYFGLVAGVTAGNVAAHAAKMNAFRAYVATLLLIVPALAGSRILYVATHPELCHSGVGDFWGRKRGGYSVYGGLPAALLVSFPVLRLLKLSIAEFWDVAIFTILVGMIFARVGCLLNGCCCGRVSSSWLAVNLPNGSGVRARRIPTQILEALLAAILLLCAIFLRSHLTLPGTLFLLLAAGYASGRFVLEFARERQPTGGVLTVAHWISLLTLVSSGSALAFCWLG
jgi:phosphatidylglycerol---prolipoprotein diacylglyceryl transferase